MFRRNTIYALKRQHGRPAVYCRVVDKSQDLETGIETVTTEVTRIQRVIFLPTNVARKTLIKTDFFFDPDRREVLIDRKDIDFEITDGDYIIYSNSRYNVVEINDYELGEGYLLIVQSDGRAKWLFVEDSLTLTQADS